MRLSRASAGLAGRGAVTAAAAGRAGRGRGGGAGRGRSAGPARVGASSRAVMPGLGARPISPSAGRSAGGLGWGPTLTSGRPAPPSPDCGPCGSAGRARDAFACRHARTASGGALTRSGRLDWLAGHLGSRRPESLALLVGRLPGPAEKALVSSGGLCSHRYHRAEIPECVSGHPSGTQGADGAAEVEGSPAGKNQPGLVTTGWAPP